MVLRFKKMEDSDAIFLRDDLAGLIALNTSDLANHSRAYVKTHGEYVFRKISILTHDALNIIEPANGGGRWIKIAGINLNNQILNILESAAAVGEGGNVSGGYLSLDPTASQIVNNGTSNLTINKTGIGDVAHSFKMYSELRFAGDTTVPTISIDTKAPNLANKPVVAFKQNYYHNLLLSENDALSSWVENRIDTWETRVEIGSQVKETSGNKIMLTSNMYNDNIYITSGNAQLYSWDNTWKFVGDVKVTGTNDFYIGGRLVDFHTGLVDGNVLTYDIATNSFVFKAPTGGSGGGTEPTPTGPVAKIDLYNYSETNDGQYADYRYKITVQNAPASIVVSYTVSDDEYGVGNVRTATVYNGEFIDYSYWNSRRAINNTVTYTLVEGEGYTLGTPSSDSLVISAVANPLTFSLSNTTQGDYQNGDYVIYDLKFDILNPKTSMMVVTVVFENVDGSDTWEEDVYIPANSTTYSENKLLWRADVDTIFNVYPKSSFSYASNTGFTITAPAKAV
jgi:hypothetical protein